jgi:hypothetical protein
MNPEILAILYALHLGVVIPYASVVVAAASAADAAFPQPGAGSHWLPLRKAVSAVAFNLGNASNGKQPPFATWLLRVLAPLMARAATLQAASSNPLPSPAPATAAPAPAN